MDNNEKKTVIKEYFSKLGKTPSAAKRLAAQKNIRLAHAAHAAPVERLEKAYQLVKANTLTMSGAYRTVAKCGWIKFREFCAKRFAEGKTK